MIQRALYEYLSGYTDLTDIVEERIYPFGDVPTGTKPETSPYVTWQLIDDVHVHHQGGASGLANPRIQIDAWAGSEFQAYTIIEVVRIALDSYRGTMGTGANEKTVRLSRIDSDNETYSPPDDAAQKGAFRASADYLGWFVEEV